MRQIMMMMTRIPTNAKTPVATKLVERKTPPSLSEFFSVAVELVVLWIYSDIKTDLNLSCIRKNDKFALLILDQLFNQISFLFTDQYAYQSVPACSLVPESSFASLISLAYFLVPLAPAYQKGQKMHKKSID